MKINLLLILILVILPVSSFSQTIEQPNYALKSHETLEIRKIETTSSATTFYMSVENRTTGGYFCADKNTFIVYPDGKRIKLTSSNGIPVCPDTYKFKLIGEKLDFILTFPPLEEGNEWIDLIEDCTDNCFSFYGITLDTGMNRRIDEAFALTRKGESVQAINSFIRIAGEAAISKKGIEGILYMNIIKLAEEAGNKALASEWYGKLVSSGNPRSELIIKHLNSQGIKY